MSFPEVMNFKLSLSACLRSKLNVYKDHSEARQAVASCFCHFVIPSVPSLKFNFNL